MEEKAKSKAKKEKKTKRKSLNLFLVIQKKDQNLYNPYTGLPQLDRESHTLLKVPLWQPIERKNPNMSAF